MYKSVPDGFKVIFRNEGFRGFTVVSLLPHLSLEGMAANPGRILRSRIWKVRIL